MNSRETVEAYFTAWNRRKWLDMYDLCQLSLKERIAVVHEKKYGGPWSGPLWYPNRFKTQFGTVKLTKWTILEDVTKDNNPVCHDYRVELYLNLKPKWTIRRELVARCICESAPMHPDPKGTWGVNPISTFKLVLPEDFKREE